MKISDVLRGLVDIVDNNSAEAPVTAGQEDNTSFTGSLKPVVLPDVQSTTRVDGDNKTPAGNDMQPEELFIPPLQMKMELLKKAVDVENIYDDGTPEQQEDARLASEGEWTGPEKHYEYVGAQTGVVEGGAKDTTEKKEESMTESEKIRAIMNRLNEEPSRMAQRAHQNFADTESLDTPGYAERVEELEDEGMDRGDAQGIADMEDMRGDYSNWKFHPSNLSEESEHEKDERAEKAGRKVTKDIEWDEKHRTDEAKADKDYDKDGKIESEKDEVWGSRMRAAEKTKKKDALDEAMDRLIAEAGCEELDELSKKTLGSYKDKSRNREHEIVKNHEYVTKGGRKELGKRVAGQAAADRALDRGEERMDELSKDTLGSYVKKASHGDTTSPLDDKHASMRDIGGAWETRPKTGSNDPKGEWKNERLRRLDKNRSKGIDRAVDRLTRESDDCQLDELSKDTLGSYIKKAKDSYGSQGLKLGNLRSDQADIDRFTNRHMDDKFGTRDALRKAMGATSDDESNIMRVASKRSHGINQAVDRLARESDDCQLDEARIDPVEAYEILDSMDVMGQDFFTLGHDKISELLQHAKRLGYRKSANAPGSTARMFFDYLSRMADGVAKRRSARGDSQLGERNAMEMGWHESADAGYGTDWQIDEQAEVARMRELAGLNPVVLDELSDNFPE